LERLTEYAVPAIIALSSLVAAIRGVDVFGALCDGAESGLKTTVRILPPLVALMTAVYMLRASGLTDALTRLLTPVFSSFGLPPETAPLVLIRPLSGSGAMAVFADIIAAYGADSYIGRTAAIMLGSTETTFYTIAVYFGASNVKKTRYAVPAALCADLTGFLFASLTAKLFF